MTIAVTHGVVMLTFMGRTFSCRRALMMAVMGTGVTHRFYRRVRCLRRSNMRHRARCEKRKSQEGHENGAQILHHDCYKGSSDWKVKQNVHCAVPSVRADKLGEVERLSIRSMYGDANTLACVQSERDQLSTIYATPNGITRIRLISHRQHFDRLLETDASQGQWAVSQRSTCLGGRCVVPYTHSK